jgi:hypothetical protein
VKFPLLEKFATNKEAAMNKTSDGRIIGSAVVLIAALVGLALAFPRIAALPQSDLASVWQADFGAWQVTFLIQESRFTCLHRESGTAVEGTLSFRAGKEEATVLWRVGLPLDSVRERLAVLDARGEVQGYVTFSAAGDLLRVGIIHRAAQNYPGELCFEGSTRMPGEAFACRTRQPENGRVVQLASGPADGFAP